MKALVIGGSGFIGKYLVAELTEYGYETKILTRNPKKGEIYGDITKRETILPALKDVDVVFHNAAYVADWGNKRKFYEINVNGTKNVADACIKVGVKRIIYTSSAGVYGFSNRKEKIDENFPKKPINYYQKSKLEAERALMQYNLHISIVRPPLVLGAGGNAVKMLLSSLEKGRVPIFGSGKQYISIAHPKDVARCLRLACERDSQGDAFNVVSFICPVKKLFDEIASRLGVAPPSRHIPYAFAFLASIFTELWADLRKAEPVLTKYRVKSFGTNRIISYEKAMKKLGYKPAYDLNATVDDMVRWYLQV